MPFLNQKGSSLIENMVSISIFALFSVLSLMVFSAGIQAFAEIRQTHLDITDGYSEMEYSDDLSSKNGSMIIQVGSETVTIGGEYVYDDAGRFGEFIRR